ncbi:glycosyltransferase [Enterococcus sp. AZ162]|uniref:glycosyltransferase n=1 Tax=unclassified Enterococcus TaxID=2608891 RepID=UPI003F238D72
MKILFFVSSFPALSETFILNQITGMIDRGHEVEILSTKKVKTEHHPEVEKYNLMSKVKYIEIPKNPISKVLKGISIFIKLSSKNPKRACSLINKKKHGNFVWNLRPLFISSFFEKNKEYDVIIAHYGYNLLLLEIIKNTYFKFPKIIGFFHGNDLNGFITRFGSEIYKPLQKPTSTLGLPISNLLLEQLNELQILIGHTKIHHMGVDCKQFNYSPPKEFKGKLRLLIVGRLTEKKGIDNAIEAVSILKIKNIHVNLKVIGDGDQKSYLEELIQARNLTKDVELLGWQTQEVVKKYVDHADLILLPSKVASNGDKEGIPVSLMEALASGKLVISTFHSGIPEIIQDGKNGWLVQENDSEALARKVKEVSQLTLNKRIEIARNARESVFLNFNIDKLNDQLDDIVKTLCLEGDHFESRRS